MSRIEESLYRVSGINLNESVSNSTLQKYKDLNFELGCCKPPHLPFTNVSQIYAWFFGEKILSKHAKQVRSTIDLWDKPFTTLLNKLPRTAHQKAYYDYYDTGFFYLLITEDYKIGFADICKDTQSLSGQGSKYNGGVRSILSFEDEFGHKVYKDFKNLSDLCIEAYNLTGENIFRHLGSAYSYVKEIIDLMNEGHITKEHSSDSNGRSIFTIYCDGAAIFETRPDPSTLFKHEYIWKI